MDKKSWSDFDHYLINKIDNLEEKVNGIDKRLVALRTKFAFIGSFFGVLSSAIFHYFQKKT